MNTLATLTDKARQYAATDAQRLAILRIAVGGYALTFLIVRFPHLWNSAAYPSSRWQPVGILSPVDSAPTAWLSRFLLIVAIPAGLGFVFGWRYRISGPLFALLFLVITTFRFSWGSVLHTEHLVVIHVVVIAFSSADHAWSKRVAQHSSSDALDLGRYKWAIETCAVATVVGYVVSGVAKIRYGGWDWISGDVLRNQIAFDNLRKIMLGDIHSPVASWIINNDAPLKFFAPLTVIFELGAPLALFCTFLQKIWIVGIWLFHAGVLIFMAIVFPYQLLGIAYLPVIFMTPFLSGRHQHNVSSHVHEPPLQQHGQSTSN
jgi:hypothetical protein